MADDWSMSAKDWGKMWTEGKTDFHIDKICNMFNEHVKEMIKERNNIKIFVPFCGKAVEMKQLREDGHEIVGVEYSEVAVEDFFKETNIGYTIEEIPAIGGKLFISKDKKIRLYACDFYNFTCEIESGFDAVWDSGALNAVNMGDQEKYIDIIKSVMAKNCINVTIIDDPQDWEIPVTHEKMKTWFQDGYSVREGKYIPANDELKALGIKGQQSYFVVKI